MDHRHRSRNFPGGPRNLYSCRVILLCEFNKFKFSRWVQVGPSNFQYQIHIVYTCLHKDHNVRATLDFFNKIKSLYLKCFCHDPLYFRTIYHLYSIFFIFYNVVHKLSVPAALLAVKLKKFDFSAFSGYLVVIVHSKIV